MDFRRAITVILGALIAVNLPTAVLAGEIQGTVQLEGPVPAPKAITITAKSKDYSIDGCGAVTKTSQALVVDAAGGIQYVIVWLEQLGATPQLNAPTTAILDQQACVFEPHVLLVPSGSTVAIGNSDPVLHNVRIFQERTMLMHEWQQPKAGPLTWRFDEPGRYLVRCGVHAWMYAWVVVADHPYYAVTNATGHFTLSGVPEGKYVLHVWHETLGEQQQRLSVTAADAIQTVRLTYERGST